MEVIKSDSELKCSNKRKFMPMDRFYSLMLMECERRSKQFDGIFFFRKLSTRTPRKSFFTFFPFSCVISHAKRRHSNSPKIKILFKNRFAHMFKRTLSKEEKRKNGNKMSRFGLKVIDYKTHKEIKSIFEIVRKIVYQRLFNDCQ